MLRDGSEMETLRDWGAKLVGATIRIAAILHCADLGVEGFISGETFTNAIRIARCLVPHTDFVLNLMDAAEDTTQPDAKYALRWIVDKKKLSFTKRELHQHGRRRFGESDRLADALTELVKRAYIRRVEPPAKPGAGRPSEIYDVNPAVFESK